VLSTGSRNSSGTSSICIARVVMSTCCDEWDVATMQNGVAHQACRPKAQGSFSTGSGHHIAGVSVVGYTYPGICASCAAITGQRGKTLGM
jgi:hypothetical protein